MIEIPKTVEDYSQKRSDYEELAERIDDILFEILELEKVNYALIDNRAKTLESFQTRMRESKNKKELYDLSGIRVVGYVRSDVEKIVKIIRKNFTVDEDKSKDKASELKPDQFGYRAIHLVCTLPNERIILPEYKKFKELYFEIQVKTILEHAWAQIEHDRNYKYKGIPKDIQHDFYLAAGILETADNQFESINKRIEKYDKSFKKKTTEGKLKEIEINPATLKSYLVDKFSKKLKLQESYGFDATGDTEVSELKYFTITNLDQLDKIVHPKLVEISQKIDPAGNNLSSMVFEILILKFKEKYYDIVNTTRYEKTKDQNILFKSTLKQYNNMASSLK